MAILYVAAGLNHFWHPDFYLQIMPPWLPSHHFLVAISGVFEVSFGLLLLFSPTRRIAAWGIILLLVAIFPANVQMMINYWNASNPDLWISILRLPLQLLLIWWAYTYTKEFKLRT